MASKKTVTLHNVASLGPERLAAILVDLAEATASPLDALPTMTPTVPDLVPA